MMLFNLNEQKPIRNTDDQDVISAEERIRRVQKYEQLFDEVLEHPDPDLDPGKIRQLEAYYTSGQWQEDYEADERGELPPDLKRGVLSQDALYDLLAERSQH